MQAEHNSTSGRPELESAIEGFAVEARGLVRRFGAVQALAGVSLQVQPGEFFCLLGPSGCGKTTLLRLIAGLDLPDSGELAICGRDVAEIPAHHRPVNTVFQSYALFPHLTARDNIAFGLRMKKVAKAEIEERVQRVMSLVQVTGLADRRPAQLSGGEKQRVALARAIVNEPKVLLLDEPLGALDLKLRKQLQVELHRLQRRLGITFIHVTHDQDEALAMSDRIAVMNAGRIEQIGAAREVYDHPRSRFVAQFVGACNLLEGKVCEAGPAGVIVETAVGALSASKVEAGRFTSGDQVVLGIRPEKVRLEMAGRGPALNALTATVEDRVYNGAETQYTLQACGQILHATLLNTNNGREPFAVGDKVECVLDPGALLVLEH